MDSFLLLKKLQPKFDVLIPFLRFEKELENELLLSSKAVLFKNEKYFITEKLAERPVWAQDWLRDCELAEFKTKADALKILKAQPCLGVHFETDANARLAVALKKEIRELGLKRIRFEVPSSFNFKYFAWGLFDSGHLILCMNPVSRFPLGWHEFNEDKDTPPNRAYLKMWEILTLDHIRLQPSDVALDVGSSPGGWSWVLSQQCRKVYSVDKAPLDKKITAIPNIHYASEDAFKISPADYPDCTWLFSDIICTPQRLLDLVALWHRESNVRNFVCTIKFKGACDFDILKEFRKYEGSTIIHLYQNKNEVTWIKQVKP